MGGRAALAKAREKEEGERAGEEAEAKARRDAEAKARKEADARAAAAEKKEKSIERTAGVGLPLASELTDGWGGLAAGQ